MNWDDGWHDRGGPWWWLVMLLMTILFWGGVAWVVTLIRHGSTGARSTHETTRPSAEDILPERLARGEIDLDEYHQRLDAAGLSSLPTPRPPPLRKAGVLPASGASTSETTALMSCSR